MGAIAKPQEESFDYKYYTGASKGPSKYDASHWIGPEGYLCPSDVDYAKITRAVNVEGYWRIILQHIPEGYGYGHYNYTWATRLETCLYPDSACRLLAPCYQSKCTQKYVYHRMLSVDPCDPYRGFFIDTTSFPALAPATFPPKPNPTRPKTKTKRTMDFPSHLDHHQLSSSLIYFLFIYSHPLFPSSLAPPHWSPQQ